jgi:hypothetical protein
LNGFLNACGAPAFVDQKDERKPIARDQRPETSGRKMQEQKISYFFLLTSEFSSTYAPPFFLLPFNF